MHESEDILSVIFLALVAIVIAGIVINITKGNTTLMIPSFVLIAVGLWIAYDKMLLDRYKAKVHCLKHGTPTNKPISVSTTTPTHKASGALIDKTDDVDLEKAIVDEIASINHETDIDDDSPPSSEDESYELLPLQKQNDAEFDIDMYTGDTPLHKLFHNMASSGDTKLANRMKYASMQPQLSKIHRASFNKYSLQPWVEEELQEHAEREWWNSDHLESEF